MTAISDLMQFVGILSSWNPDLVERVGKVNGDGKRCSEEKSECEYLKMGIIPKSVRPAYEHLVCNGCSQECVINYLQGDERAELPDNTGRETNRIYLGGRL